MGQSKEIVNVFWHCADDDGNFNFYEEENEDFVIDLTTGKIYTPSDDIGELDDPYFFTTSAGSNFMHEMISEDGSFLSDELTEKWLTQAIKKQITEPDLTGTKIIRLHKWVKPHHGEISLIYEIDSFQSNHPLDPVEWDMTIDCVGSLGDNHKIVKIDE